MNPFGKTMCPKSGWRRQCGEKCMYKHYEDGPNRSQKLSEAQATKITQLKNGSVCGPRFVMVLGS